MGRDKEGKIRVIESVKVSREELSRAILTYLVIMIIKDNFNDFEELKVITPVRDEALSLFVSLIPHIP